MSAPAAASACDICRIHGDAARYGDLECHRGAHWLVRHHPLPSPLVGWTFLCAVRHVQGPADFTDAEAEGFGRAMRAVSAAVRSITGCDRVYAIAFGQGAPHLHVHLIPRFDAEEGTRAWNVADWYRAVERGERPAADPAAVADFVRRLRSMLASAPID